MDWRSKTGNIRRYDDDKGMIYVTSQEAHENCNDELVNFVFFYLNIRVDIGSENAL